MQIFGNHSYTNGTIGGQNYSYGSDPRPNVHKPKWQINGTYESETIHGDNLDNEISGHGGLDILYGHGGNDILHTGGDAPIVKTEWNTILDEYAYGGLGNDTLYGNSLRDWLSGDQDNDQLFGYAGNDWLYGGSGSDKMTGGTGADVFVFYDILEMQNDVITDFNQAEGDVLGIGTPLAQANGGVVFYETIQNGASGVKMTFNKVATHDSPNAFSGSIFVQGMDYNEAWDLIIG